MTLALSGIGVSPGIAIGKARLLLRTELEIPEYCVARARVGAEEARYRRALDEAKGQLKAVRTRIPGDTPADIAAFIDTHLLMLDDVSLTEAPVKLMREQRCNAEWALKQHRDALVAVFDEMEDAYLRTRKDDVDHVVDRIQRVLLGHEDHAGEDEGPRLSGQILIADDLTPADTVLMQHQGIAAFVTEYGGPLSHTAILARSLGIPAVVGVHPVRRYLRDGETVVVDGRQGAVIAEPNERMLDHYRKRRTRDRRIRGQLGRLREKPAVTRDGCAIALSANIELPEDLEAVNTAGAAGVGLFRTEFLYMNRPDVPDEDEHLDAYRRVLESLGGRPLTIRTLDLGADKEVDGARPTTGRLCNNPALGLRAIRLCLKDPSLFRPQLRAILRASALGSVRMMIPMLSNQRELTQVLHLVEDVKRELKRQGLKYDPDMPVGGMIEIPAAALTAAELGRRLDFLSIGTNDLIQYTLAIDRIDEEVNYLYDPLHPAVLRLIRMVIEAGHTAGIPVSMCGEMAGDPTYTRLLLGLGLTEFSMQPAAVLEIKRIVTRSHVKALKEPAARMLDADHSERVALLDEMNG